MTGFLDWRVIESMTGWASRPGDEEIERWDETAASWNHRTLFERDFTAAQCAAVKIEPTDTVLDACCGAGRLSIPLARRARSVTALDGGARMLEHCAAYAKQEGLSNVSTLRVPNWHRVEPGVDFPVHDVVVACISPASADIVKLSRAARRRCYSLSFARPFKFLDVLASLFAGADDAWPENPEERLSASQLTRYDVPRVFGLNVPFNILFDLGANPTVEYAEGSWNYEAETPEEIYDFLRVFGNVSPDRETVFRRNVDTRLSALPDGRYRYETPRAVMYALGWDPAELDYERAELSLARYDG